MKKRILMAGGILAVALGLGGNEVQQANERAAAVAEFKQDKMVEYAKRQIGQEIKSLRTETSETFKAAPLPDGKPRFQAKVYSGQHFWKDADADTLRPLDLTVREISALARLNPLRTHDKYVDAGPYVAKWMNDIPGNFRMETGGLALEYRAIYDGKGIVVQTEPIPDGMKETITLADENAATTLRWLVQTDGTLVAQEDNSFNVRARDGSTPMRIDAPRAWDKNGKPVMVVASVAGDTLTFKVTVLPGQEYPLTVDPTSIIATNNGYAYSDNTDPPTYTDARNAITGSAKATNMFSVGQLIDFRIGRGFASFVIPDMSSISAASLFLEGNGDASVVDFEIYINTSTYSSPLVKEDFDLFDGWQASGAYNGSILNNTWNSSSYSATWNEIVFNAAGLAAVLAKKNDTFKIVVLSKEDYNSSEPTDAEWINFESATTAGKEPYLSITYTLAPTAPTNFTNTGATTTTLSYSWTDNSSDESGFKIKKAGGDTVTVGSYAAGATTGTVSGLGFNTRNGLRVFAYNAGGWSAPSDSVVKYTLAIQDTLWAFTAFSSSAITPGFDDNGNPATTTHAIRDSTRQVWVATDGTSNGQTKAWQTEAQWEAITVSGLTNSTEYRFGIIAKNGDAVETSYIWGTVYTLANPPTVTTQAASSVEATTATGNGNITAISGGNCTRRGFCYMTGTSGDPTTANSVAYDDGDYGTGAYTKGITGLSSGTSYRVRAYAVNSAGTGYGTTVQILTKPAAPTNVAATENNSTKVVITWTVSTGATDYHVWRDTTDLGAAGDVATFDDTGAAAPIITPGAATAADGTSCTYITLSVNESIANGTSYTYKVVASNATGNSADSGTDTGYRLAGTVTYQWQRSAGDSDASYSNISGGTTDPYNDTGTPDSGAGRYFKCVMDATGSVQATSTADRGYMADVNAPTGFILHSPTTTSLKASWTNHHSLEIDSLRIYSLGSWVKTLAITDTTTTITGLTINTQYIYNARVDSAGANEYSIADTAYTAVNPPNAWAFVEDISDSTKITIGFGTNSNPASTVYAIRDSTARKWVSSAAGLSDSTWKVWRTAAQWATTASLTGHSKGVKYRLGVVARNADGVETAYIWDDMAIIHFKYSLSLTNFSTQKVWATTYAAARSVASYLGVTTTAIDTIGQHLAGAADTSIVYRGYMRTTSPMPVWNDVTAAHVILQGVEDGSTTNFNIKLYWDSNIGGVAASRYYTFSGWAAGTGAYAIAPITQAFNTANFHAAEWDTINFSGPQGTAGTGLAKLLSASADSTVRFAIVSGNDSSATAPTGDEWVTFSTTNPRLEVTAGWVDAVPTSIVATSIAGATDSILVTWVDNSITETGYALVDSATGLRMGGNDSTAVGITVKRYGGLSPNSYHAIKVMVLGGQIDEEISTASDACYTRAAVPGLPTVTFPSDVLLKFVLNVNGNPSFTEFAVQDSVTGKYVDFISGVVDTFTAAAEWRTYAGWGSTLGDTVAVSPGKKYTIRVKARSGQ